MILKTLALKNFRNYTQAFFQFHPQTNLVLGPNAAGKTNLLEAIFLLGRGKSFKAETNQQIIAWNQSFSLIEAEVSAGEENLLLTLRLKIAPQEKRVQKTFLINQVPKTRKEFLSQFHLVLFRPEDIRVVSGSPLRRREFLNTILAPLDWRYSRSLSLYRRALRQRNQLLDKIREGQGRREELFFWDKTLIKNGQFISSVRRELVEAINSFLEKNEEKEINQLRINYQPSLVDEKKLALFLDRDLRFGFTSIGPHKDEFIIENQAFKTTEKNIAFWGSRAQQRLAVLALKLAETEFVHQKTGQRPVLLLDDIFSELDQFHRRLLARIFRKKQIIVTATAPPPASLWRPEKTINLQEKGGKEKEPG